MASGGNKNSGRRSVISMRPDRDSITRDIVLERYPMAEIARRIGVSYDSVKRWKDKITDEQRARILASNRVGDLETDVEVINQDRMDVAVTYESLAKRVERLISKAEQNDDDAFALSAMEGLRKVLRDIAQLQGKLATSLTVNVTLAESKEWQTLRRILGEVCEEVPAAREPLLRRMRHEVLSVTKEPGGAL